MTSLADVTEALAGRLRTIGGLNVTDYVPGQLNPPHLVVGAPAIPDYTDDLGLGSFMADIELLLFVTASVDINQRLLYPYMERTGTQSLFATVRADPSLGFTDVYAYVTSGQQLGYTQIAAYQAFGASFVVRCSIGG